MIGDVLRGSADSEKSQRPPGEGWSKSGEVGSKAKVFYDLSGFLLGFLVILVLVCPVFWGF